MTCKFKNKTKRVKFFVADVMGSALAGLPMLRSLKIVQINCSVKSDCKMIPNSINKEQLKERFPERFKGLGRLKGEYKIPIDEKVPPKHQRAKPVPIHIAPEIKAGIDEMVRDGVLAPVTEATKWLASLAFSQKPNKKWRICLDPTALNRAVIRTMHYTPTLEEISHQLRGAIVFSKLDAKNGYWSIILDEESSYLTTFNTPWGRYRYLRCPFGVKSSQDEFQRRMDAILQQCNGTIGIADDVVVYGRSIEEHDKNLINLMEVAEREGLVFNYEKCDISVPRVTFFGQVYSKEGVHPDPEKVKAIKCIEAPKDVKELQTFLGLANYMSQFIPHLATISAPLRDLTKHNMEYIWSSHHQKAFDDIKTLICRAVNNAYFDPRKDTIVEVDASLEGLGGALTQEGKVIMYASKRLTPTERRYPNIEREMLAVVWAINRFHNFLYGKKFEIISDHQPLEKINLKDYTDVTPRLQRMCHAIAPYDFKITWRPGKKMLLADPLSRLSPLPGPEVEGMDVRVASIHFSGILNEAIRDATMADPALNKLKAYIYEGFPKYSKQMPTELQWYWSFRDKLSIENGIITVGERLLIPPKFRPRMIEALHEGHMGIEKTLWRARRSIYWPTVTQDIKNKIINCEICQRHQKSLPKEPLKEYEIPTRPWQVLGSDVFSLDEENHLITADYYSKFPVVQEIPKHQYTSKGLIKLLKEKFSENGTPEILISDNGPQYASAEFARFSEEWGFQHIKVSPRHPQGNGFIERQIQTCKAIMKKAKAAGQDIQKALQIWRATPIAHDLPSPAEILNNRKIASNLPIKIENNLPDADTIAEKLIEKQKKQKQYFDRNTRERPPPYEGQRVYVQDTISKIWRKGEVLLVHSDRSVSVRLEDGRIFRRNTAFVRPNLGLMSDVPQQRTNLANALPQREQRPLPHAFAKDQTLGNHTPTGNISKSANVPIVSRPQSVQDNVSNQGSINNTQKEGNISLNAPNPSGNSATACQGSSLPPIKMKIVRHGSEHKASLAMNDSNFPPLNIQQQNQSRPRRERKKPSRYIEEM